MFIEKRAKKKKKYDESKKGKGTTTYGKKFHLLLFEWLHFRILSTESQINLKSLCTAQKKKKHRGLLFESKDSNMRTTLCSIINSITGKYCSATFI